LFEKQLCLGLLAALLAAAPAAQAQDPVPAEEEAPAAQDPSPQPVAQETPPQEAPAQEAPVQETPEQQTPEQETAEQEPALPAARDATRLDTIEVTASKRLKSQRDIPGSVAAIRGVQLESMRAQSMRDYLKLVPGITLIDQGNDQSVPIIRGIASQVGFGFTPQATGIYLDDMPFADLLAPLSLPDINPFDLERVEVLKGPQGTLFGSGALAGAVRYIAQKPNHGVWEGKVYETVSDTRTGGGYAPTSAAAVNVPLFGDAVALRAVGMTRREPGLYDMSATDGNGNTLRDEPNADRLKQNSWRGLASWNVTDELKLSAFYFGQQTHTDDASFPMDFAPFPSPTDYNFGGGNLLATYDFGWGRLLSSTNRLTKHTRSVFHQEFLLSPMEQQNDDEFYNQLIGDVDGFTQELRLSSPEGGDDSGWDWLVGASVMRYTGHIFQYEPLPGPPMPPPERPEDLTTAERANSFLFATVDSEGTEKALFGEATRKLGDHWELTLGARKYATKLIADTVVSGAQIVALTQKAEDVEHFEPTSKGVNPKAAIRYLHNDNVQWYLLAAKGFQFGGVQLNPPVPLFVTSTEQAGFHFAPYKSSDLWNYESGIRTEWLDRRLRFDIGVFYLDWKDLQLTVAIPVQGTDATFGVIANVGRAHSEGVETTLQVIPFPGATWTTNAAWITAVTDVLFDSSAADGGVKPGTRLPGTPKFALSNVFAYEHPLPYFSNWSISPALTHTHVGEAPDEIRPNGTMLGYDTLDARLALLKTDSRYLPELSFGVNNLTDVKGTTYHQQVDAATNDNVFHLVHFTQPRTAVLSLSFKY
jgi:outer membrane receptor protein involved in Fe transport